MEHRKMKRSEAKKCWDGIKYTKSDLRLAAKPERDRKRDRWLLIVLSAFCLLLALLGKNEAMKVSGSFLMFILTIASVNV